MPIAEAIIISRLSPISSDFGKQIQGFFTDFLSQMGGIINKFAPKGVEFVGVSFDTKAESWKNGVEKLGIKYTQVSDMKNMRESAVAQTYAIKWIPTVYVIGPDGKVVLATVMSDKVGAYLTSVYPDCAE